MCIWKRKTAATVLGMALAVSLLTGCGKGQEESLPLPQAKGRYVERELAVPAEWEEQNICRIFRQKEQLHLLLCSNMEGNARLSEWVLQEDGSFQEVTKAWLKEVSIPYEEYGNLKLMEDSSGTQYLYACYVEEEEDSYKGHLWRSDGETAMEITPEKWQNPVEEYGFYDYPSDIALTDHGTLVSCSFLGLDLISGEDGSLVSTTEPEGYFGDWVEACGDQIYQYNMGNTGEVISLVIRQYDQITSMEAIPFSQGKSSSVCFHVLEDGTVIAADADGFFKCAADGQEWEALLDGVDTSFALTNLWCKEIAALADGSFYGLFGSEEGTRLMEYRYDPEAVVEVTETLTLYTVTESYLLQQAAALYHRANPQVLIQIETGFSKMESYTAEPDYDQIYQELNTALLAGNGPDLLVLDGLPMEAYASKGLLADIEDLVGTLEKDGSLLANVTGSFRGEDGSRYAVPLQFGLYLAIGRDVETGEMESLESLARLLSENEESYLGPQTTTELVEKFYPFFAGEIVEDGELSREALTVHLKQLKQIADNCGILESREENSWCYNVWDIPFRCRLAFYEIEGFNNAMLPVSVANLVNGSYTCFEQAYEPKLVLAANSAGGHLETARDFIAFALSEAVQSSDYYEGFPVNAASLEVLAGRDRRAAEAYTTIEIDEGMYEEFTIKSFPEEDAVRLVEMCREASVRIDRDTQICAALVENLPGYLKGAKSLEETLDAIEGSLKMYLAE